MMTLEEAQEQLVKLNRDNVKLYNLLVRAYMSLSYYQFLELNTDIETLMQEREEREKAKCLKA